MAFLQRPDGLIDVDTPMGPMPMAPEVAMQLGWTPGTAEAGVQGPASLEQQGAMAQYGGGLPQAAPMQPPAPPAPAGDDWSVSVGHPAALPPSDLQAFTPPGQAQQQAPAPQPVSPMDLARQELEAGPRSYYQAGRAAGYAPVARTQRGTAPIEGERRESIEGSLGQQMGAQEKIAQSQGAVADALTQQANAEAAAAKRMAESEAIRRQRIDTKMAEMQAKREELRNAVPDEIDEGRWNKMGGGGAILAAVSIALGGIAQGLRGGDNPGVTAINDLIARDIQAQKDEIALAQDSADTADNDLQRYMDIYGDPILAEKQLELNGLEAVKKEMQARVQSAQGEQEKALAIQGIADLNVNQEKLRQDMDGRGGELVTQEQYDPGQAAGMRRESDEAWLGRVKGRAELGKLLDPSASLRESDKKAIRETQVIMPDGKIRYAKDAGVATRIGVLNEARKRGDQILAELEAIAATPGSSMSPEQRDRATQLEGELIKTVASTLAPGEAVSDSEKTYYGSIAVDSVAGADMLGTVKAKIKNVRNMFKMRAENAAAGNLYQDQDRQIPLGESVTGTGDAEDAGWTP